MPRVALARSLLSVAPDDHAAAELGRPGLPGDRPRQSLRSRRLPFHPAGRLGLGRGGVRLAGRHQARHVSGDRVRSDPDPRRSPPMVFWSPPRPVPAGHLAAWLVRVRTGDPPAHDLAPARLRRPLSPRPLDPADRDDERRVASRGEPVGVHPGPAQWRASMADLTERQKQEYWRYNVRLTTILLVIWFVVTYLISGLWAGWLNQYTILGFPLGYYMAAQGSLAIFVDRDRGLRLPHEQEGRRVRHPRGGLDRHEPGQDLRPLHGRLPRRHRAHRHRRGASASSATR